MPKSSDYPLKTAIQAEYVRGVKPGKLSGKYGIPAKTISNWASAEKWKVQREETGKKFNEILPEKIAHALANKAAEWITESLEISSDLRAIIKSRLDASCKQSVVMTGAKGPEIIKIPLLNTTRDIENIVKALAGIDRVGRQALGLKDGTPNQPPDESLNSLTNAIKSSQRRRDEEGA